MRLIMRLTMRAIALLPITAALLLGTNEARAHAYLDHASPAVGSSVRTPPRLLQLWFTQNLEPSFSTVEVTGPNGSRVDQGARVDGANRMRVGIRPAGPGSYHVHWRVLSVDTHTTEGSYSFRVGE
jgi:copper resistance protein C